ncbi:DUF302 domain-containing protein [Jannaschia aquimarina]|uniref:DUF302 domain-containing protein n=1 Tax=Jannaschia aquimarina TaxID=935700 RepID=A0A0D1DAC4_9RHOB|nr:DUF302 domain-containing protein [Jannaschia aquimarina]KIT16848.1 hypothetical protein jaqu_13450 [Jannaschia aquimarina]SNT13080.1 Uncharacterized conserved protein, DUF302 family [Jannaschia aquimarina]
MIRSLTLALILAGAPAMAEIVTKPSPHSVGETADRLVAAAEGAGATIVARVLHSQAAAGVDMELAEAELVIFGNPRAGTPVMQQDLRAGAVLPLRVLVHADGDAAAVTYQSAESLFAGLDVDLSSEAAIRIDGALSTLTDAAVASD